MKFKGIQKIYKYVQQNYGSISDVFLLLCPVREKDWLDGWNYRMIHSNSGLAEKDCVFTTPFNEKFDTVWQITQHDPINHKIEFLRVTPGENIVKINIELELINPNQTETQIRYQYTGLNPDQNSFIENELEDSFKQNMIYWEAAINHYLKTGEMLQK